LQVPTIVTDPLSFTYRLELEAVMPGGNNPTVSLHTRVHISLGLEASTFGI
jgi:hypothetical protein